MSQDLIVGKIAARIPWVGYLSILSHDVLGVSGDSMAIALIIILVIIFIASEFGISLLQRKLTTVGQQPAVERSQMYL